MANGDQVAPDNDHGVSWTEDAGVTFETAPRKMRFVRVSLDELEDLKSSSSSLELGLAGISAGALLTCGTTLATVTLTDPITKGVFIVTTIVFAVFTVYFSLATYRAEKKWATRIERLKRGKQD